MSQTEPIAASLLATGAAGAALRVDFCQRGDRIAHRVVVVQGDAEYGILHSIEGAEDEPWPPSPALQSLNHEQLARSASDGAACPAVLVGMSGRSHWSLAVEAAVVDGRPALIFDAAVRVKEQPAGPLGSSYRLHVPADAADGAALRLKTSAGVVELTQQPLSDGADSFSPSLQLADDVCRIACPGDDAVTLPATLRWQYRLSLIS